ncbi:MAG TPA: replication factor C large subunit [Methanocorpusculum sp.]|nr:replication factor C large subunit [Methanocorpusculum sp.]
MDWAEKYRPQHLSDILGNTAAVRQMAMWAQNWTPASAPLLITGKPGIGKTSAALALARDMEWEVLELNASDARTKAIIERIAGNSATTASLFGSSRKLIIIDEADNLEGNADRGGARAIADLLKVAKQPVLLIANDAYGVSDSIRRLCEPVSFRAIAASTLAKRVLEICAIEHIQCTPETATIIAESAKGDLRSAVNMLAAAASGVESIDESSVTTAQKDERATIFDLVGSVAAGEPDAKLQKLSFECEEKPDYVIQWIEEAVTQMSHPPRRLRAYRRISRADAYLGRTMRRQYYTMWRYATSLMTIGTASEVSATGYRPRVMPPARWKRMASAKKQKTVRRSLAAAVAAVTPIPDAAVREEYVTLLSRIADADPEGFCEKYDLDDDELTVVLGDKVRATAAFKAVQKAAKEREIKMKKLAAAKKKKTVEPAVAESPKPEPVAAAPVVEEQVEEKKPVASQATLDFF